jgi:putative membrane protein
MNTFNHGWGMGFTWLVPILILGVIFYFLHKKKEKESSAHDILDKRYASGGISTKEYEEKSKQLKKHH